ncbi:MAG: T9SS type A sorting domain-containing protein [Ignavibacteriales bacterium]|nr:T9SS type A sorting domain-containing protein [Ignavibacteriales bacterium]
MRKNFLFLLLITSAIFGQINPSEFPKIGWHDMYYFMLTSVTDPGMRGTYADSNYFYHRMQELGITHFVTEVGSEVYSNFKNTGFKVLHPIYPRKANDPYHNVTKYLFASGNYENNFPYEVGGEQIARIDNVDERAGLGVDNICSWWIYPFQDLTVGETNKKDGDIFVNYCEVGNHTPGLIMRADIDPRHFPYYMLNDFYYQYRLGLNAKIDGAYGSDTVMIIHISEYNWKNPDQPEHMSYLKSLNYINNNSQQKFSTSIDTTNEVFYITADDFNSSGYVNIITPPFYKYNRFDWNLKIEIEWTGKRNLYIDKIFLFDDKYNDLYIANSTIQQTTRNNIRNDLNVLFQDKMYNLSEQTLGLYNDEPFPINYRANGTVSELAQQNFGQGKEVIGATMSMGNHEMILGNQFRRLPFLMYDYYPFNYYYKYESTGENNLQIALGKLIKNDLGVPNLDVRSGLRSAIEWAQNFTPNYFEDDVPLIPVIQVQSEKVVENGEVTDQYLRAPTPEEISVQGWLGICYGAKGLGYYAVPTYKYPINTEKTKYVYLFGLFDEEGNPFNDIDTIQGLIQDPNKLQVPNERFYAVKKLNQQMDKIKDELLQLTWMDAISGHIENSKLYIANVESFNSSMVKDNSSETFVEVGFLRKTTDYYNDNCEYFVVVNRRCLPSEMRNVKVTINKTTSPFNNWKLTEVGTSNSWYVSKTGNFQTTYNPGEGKLFKMEPVMLVGGTLVTNETVSSSITTRGNITVSAGITLQVNAGGNVTLDNSFSIQNNGSIYVNSTGNIILNPYAYLRNNNVLQINSGGNITFSNYSYIQNYGTLKAIGTSSNRARLTRPSNVYGTYQIYSYAGKVLEYSYANINGIKHSINGTTSNLSSMKFNNSILSDIQMMAYYSNTRIEYSTLNYSGSTPVHLNFNNSIVRSYFSNYTRYNLVIRYGGTNESQVYDCSFNNGTLAMISNIGFFYRNIFLNSTYGVHNYASNMIINWCRFVNNTNGIYCDYNSQLDLNTTYHYENPIDSNNVFNNNKYGVYIKSNGNGNLGTYQEHPSGLWCYGGFNHFILGGQTLYNVYSLKSTQIKAEANFWPYEGFEYNFKNYGNVDVYPTADEIVGEMSFKVADGKLSKGTGDKKENSDTLMLQAYILMKDTLYEDAAEIYKKIIDSKKDDFEVEALINLVYCYKMLKDTTSLNNYLLQKESEKQNTKFGRVISSFVVSEFANRGKYQEAIDKNFDLITKLKNLKQDKENKEDLASVLYHQGVLYEVLANMNLEPEGDGPKVISKSGEMNEKSKSYFDEILRDLADTETAKFLKHFYKNEEQRAFMQMEVLPTEYKLEGNYPNPFNPSTTIKYSLPFNSNVRLIIYDILGREVVELVNNSEQAGVKKVLWNGLTSNGSMVSSGIYIYRIEATSLENSATFNAVEKMMLLK